MSHELREEARLREKERERASRRREQFTHDMHVLAATAEGRRFFRWLIDMGNIFSDEFEPGAMGAYRAGRKATAIRLWRVLRNSLPRETFADIALPRDEESISAPDQATAMNRENS